MSKQDIFKALDSLVGLQSVKHEIREIVNELAIQTCTGSVQAGLVTRNYAFIGNPGTGKSTVAEIFGRILKDIGALPEGQVVTVTRADLVGSYVGASGQKTRQAVEKAHGGILFIDEAFSLQFGDDDVFGQEALDTLLYLMETRRGDFVCIFSGCPEETKRFLDSLPGLKSRIGRILMFEDFTPSELMELFMKMKGILPMDPEAGQLLADKFERMYAERGPDFGNARMVKNLLKEIETRMRSRDISGGLSDGAGFNEIIDHVFSNFRITKEDII